MPTVTANAAAALNTPAATVPISGMSLSISRKPYLMVHQVSAPPPTAPLNWAKVPGVHATP
jgi:hypothetical protein